MKNETASLLISSNQLYDKVKYFAQIVLPAVATLYFALSEIWGFPYGAEVIGTIAAFDTFLGVLLGVSASQYNKSESRFDGTIDVLEGEERKLFTLSLDGDPYDLEKKSEVIFRVNKEHDGV